MGRPKGSKNRSTDSVALPPGEDKTGHNANGGLTDEQRQALFFQHKKSYQAKLAAKKETDAAFKNACELARAELGKDAVDEIKDAILLEADEGDAILQARIERQLRIARYMGAIAGTQFEMFAGPDRTPAVDRAREEGRRSGMQGETLRSPYDPGLPQNDAFIEGWHLGQKALFSIQRTDDGALFDEGGAAIGDRAATFTETAATH